MSTPKTTATAQVIDGKARAAKLRADTAAKVAKFKEITGKTPGLAVVIVGEDPASQIYVRNKVRQTEDAGMVSLHHVLPDTTSEDTLLDLINTLNTDDSVNGILVQLPLPKHISSARVIEAINPAKDVDGFHVVNAGLLATGGKGLVPCTPRGCMMMIEEALGNISGLDALVIGRSNIVGKPMAQLLLAASATVTIAHSRTKNLEDLVRRADIVVAAVGVAELVKGAWVKPGACIIDVGMNRLPPATPGGKDQLKGDVEYGAAAERAGFITPVPGGVGPMTIACLLANTLTAACAQHKLDEASL